MTDLVTRLRLGASISRDRNLNLDYATVADEAADAIERLNGEVARLKEAFGTIDKHDYELLKSERDSLKAELAALKEQQPCASIAFCTINGAGDCTCGVVGPCEKLTDVYLAAGAKP